MQRYTNFIASTTATNSTLTVLSNASCVVYIAGTLGAATLYSDNAATPTPLANPFLSSATGMIDFYAANGRYDVVVSKVGYLTVTISDIELDDLLAPSGSNSVGYLPAGASAVATTVQTKLRESVSVKDFGAVGDGFTDDTAAIQLAITAGAGKELYFPAATYIISSALTIVSANTRLVGDGFGTVIKNTSLTGHALKFFPNNTTATSVFLNSCGIADMQIYSAVNKTAGAGVYALQCNGFRLDRVQITNHPEGLLVSGGQLNVFNAPTIFASSAVLTGAPVANSQAVRFCEAPIDGGLYQNCYTCEVTNIQVGANRCLDKSIRIESCDGLHITNGYISAAYSDEVFIKVVTAAQYVANLAFENVYLDGVGMAAAPVNRNGINFPASALGNVFSVSFNNGFIGNYSGKGVVCSENVYQVSFTGGTKFANIDNWAIDFVGSNTTTELIVDACQFRDVGEVTVTTGGVSVSTVASVVITGNTFSGIGNTGASAISTSGTNNYGVIENNAFYLNTVNVTDSATWTRVIGLPVAFSPTITFAVPGDLAVTYTTRIGRSMQKGNLCTVTFTILTASFTFTTASGNLLITGLPVISTTVGTQSSGDLVFGVITKATYTNFACRKESSNTQINIQASGSAVGASFVVAADTPSTGTLTLIGSVTYEVLP